MFFIYFSEDFSAFWEHLYIIVFFCSWIEQLIKDWPFLGNSLTSFRRKRNKIIDKLCLSIFMFHFKLIKFLSKTFLDFINNHRWKLFIFKKEARYHGMNIDLIVKIEVFLSLSYLCWLISWFKLKEILHCHCLDSNHFIYIFPQFYQQLIFVRQIFSFVVTDNLTLKI